MRVQLYSVVRLGVCTYYNNGRRVPSKFGVRGGGQNRRVDRLRRGRTWYAKRAG